MIRKKRNHPPRRICECRSCDVGFVHGGAADLLTQPILETDPLLRRGKLIARIRDLRAEILECYKQIERLEQTFWDVIGSERSTSNTFAAQRGDAVEYKHAKAEVDRLLSVTKQLLNNREECSHVRARCNFLWSAQAHFMSEVVGIEVRHA